MSNITVVVHIDTEPSENGIADVCCMCYAEYFWLREIWSTFEIMRKRDVDRPGELLVWLSRNH